jgi:hypothetical protein
MIPSGSFLIRIQGKFEHRISPEDLIIHHEELVSSLLHMHKKVEEVKSNLGRTERLNRNKDSKIQFHKFDKGDFVLVGTSKRKDKLEAKGKIPFRITDVINDFVFQVEEVLKNLVKEVYSVRLR